jgi:protein involved in polysaccharide export with SLBB domain
LAKLNRKKSPFYTLTCVVTALVAALVGACGGLTQVSPADESPAAGASGVESKLAQGEKLRIVVAGEEKLSGEFTIDPTGSIVFPLIGKTEGEGLTAHELEAALAGKLKGRYLVNPHVYVEVLSHRPFYVMGEVKNVGEFVYKPGLNVVTAILLAGGYGPRASSRVVYIKRASGGSEKEHQADVSVPVYPGDIIRVPERLF